MKLPIRQLLKEWLYPTGTSLARGCAELGAALDAAPLNTFSSLDQALPERSTARGEKD